MLTSTNNRKLFSSVEEMLAPEILGCLLGVQIDCTEREPVEFWGTSGNKMERIKLSGSAHDPLMVKFISCETDWLMHSTHDRTCRSVTLWQDGILDKPDQYLDHTVIACARTENGWAILMRDVTDNLIEGIMTKKQMYRLLDSLAGMHATFWQHDELTAYDLCDTATFLNGFSYDNAVQIIGVPNVLPEWIQAGWGCLKDMLEPQLFNDFLQLRNDPMPLIEMLNTLPRTLCHGDFRKGNIALEPNGKTRPAVFDWQLAGYTLMTIDLAWFINHPNTLQAMPIVESAPYYRHRLESYLGIKFEDAYWQKMLDLGLLANALRFTAFEANMCHSSTDPEWRTFVNEQFPRYNEQIENGVRWV